MPLAGDQLTGGTIAAVDAIELVPGARVHPPVVIGETRSPLSWSMSPSDASDAPLILDASSVDDAASPAARLTVCQDDGSGAIRLAWEIDWLTDSVAAIEFPVSVALASASARSLLVPGIHYGWETVPRSSGNPDYGRYPHLDPARGFAIRADRLPQPAVIVGDATHSWALLAKGESPNPPRSELLYSIFAGPAEPDVLRLGFRYPQVEFGHGPGNNDLAYIAKGVFGHGEDRKIRWRAGDHLTVELELMAFVGPPEANAGVVPRHLWQSARVDWTGSLPPLAGARERVRWIDDHLWDADLVQYESPEGSGTAMAGFVEMSLTLACGVARIASMASPPDSASHGAGNSQQRTARSYEAIGSWLSDGTDEDGRLFPIRDVSGFHLGRRRYDGDPESNITNEAIIESIRPAVECRSILGLLRQSPPSLDDQAATAWRAHVARVARWLARQRVGGVLPGVVGGAPASEGDDRGSAHLVSLLADLATDEPSDQVADEFRSQAEETYRLAVAPRVERRAFGGVTLDAACPDREAVAAVLDASLALFEATSEDRYLADAANAVDTLLTYVYAYSINTFGGASDACERDISTLGASLVSAENQHLDPYPVGPLLVRYGLFADDDAAITAGLANTTWCLDGRWAIHSADGVKQSEQFCHTAWHYNSHFTQRGDYRRGMPIHDRSDSEHGWAQALPLSALLDLGHVTLDWPTGRAASLPGLEVQVQRQDAGYGVEVVSTSEPNSQLESPLLLRVLRPPKRRSMRLVSEESATVVSWPTTLTSLVVRAGSWPLFLSAG